MRKTFWACIILSSLVWRAEAIASDVSIVVNEDGTGQQQIDIDKFESRRLAGSVVAELTNRINMKLFVEPSNGTFSPHALTIFVRCSNPLALAYYTLDGSPPTLSSTFTTYDQPYINVDTPFAVKRNRILRIICAVIEVDSLYALSPEIKNHYAVEATDRPGSYGFLVPGVESSGYFLRVGLEMSAAARAQLAGGQEFADFATPLGVGTYATQIRALNLLGVDPDLQGFEGGFPANTNGRYYGYLVPHHNGQKFFGKVVRVDLQGMENVTNCELYIHSEYFDEASGHVVSSGVSADEACVTVLDLESLHPRAVGFMKGFSGVISGRTYGFLSPGQYDVVVRLDLQDFGLNSTKVIPLGDYETYMGGYSGGFVDDTWACFSPLRSYVGPIGGVRSRLPVDAHHLRPYHHAVFVCVNHSAWTEKDMTNYPNSIRTFDLGDVESSLRGFANTIRVGRFIYIAPFASGVNIYSSKLIRISCGDINIIDTIDKTVAAGGTLRDLILSLDLTQKDTGLVGFSGIYAAGKYLYLCPWRGTHEPRNGQRGHGRIPRIDMNIFDIEGMDVIDLPTALRSQIPSFPDINMRGYSDCFASGKYGLYIPFYNGQFHGIVGRVNIVSFADVQQLNLAVDRARPDTYVGYRGGFTNLWQGWFEDATTN